MPYVRELGKLHDFPTKYHRNKSPSHHIISKVNDINTASLLMLTLITWVKKYFPGFFIPLYINSLRGRKPLWAHTLKTWRVIPTALRIIYINYLEYFAWEICFFFSFIYSMMCWYQCVLMDIYFILWVIIQYHNIYIVAQIVAALAMGVQEPTVSLWHTRINVFYCCLSIS